MRWLDELLPSCFYRTVRNCWKSGIRTLDTGTDHVHGWPGSANDKTEEGREGNYAKTYTPGGLARLFLSSVPSVGGKVGLNCYFFCALLLLGDVRRRFLMGLLFFFSYFCFDHLLFIDAAFSDG